MGVTHLPKHAGILAIPWHPTISDELLLISPVGLVRSHFWPPSHYIPVNVGYPIVFPNIFPSKIWFHPIFDFRVNNFRHVTTLRIRECLRFETAILSEGDLFVESHGDRNGGCRSHGASPIALLMFISWKIL
jgi:hypothetical protein